MVKYNSFEEASLLVSIDESFMVKGIAGSLHVVDWTSNDHPMFRLLSIEYDRNDEDLAIHGTKLQYSISTLTSVRYNPEEDDRKILLGALILLVSRISLPAP